MKISKRHYAEVQRLGWWRQLLAEHPEAEGLRLFSEMFDPRRPEFELELEPEKERPPAVR